MAMPWTPESRVSLFNLLPQSMPHGQPESANVRIPGQSADSITASADKSEPAPTSATAVAEERPEAITVTPQPTAETGSSAKTTSRQFVDMLPLAWLVGALVLAAYVCASNLNFLRIVRLRRPVTDQKVLDLLEDCKSQMGIRTILGVVATDKVKCPALFGFVRPRLLLPDGMIEALSKQELRYVLLHELAHLKRHDIYVGWLVSLLQILHWFNPLVWLAFYRMRADRELACDALVLARTQSYEPKSYGRIIVNLVERFSRPQRLPGMAGILETKVQLKRRITMIAQFKKNSYQWSPLAVILIIILSCVSLPDAKHTRASGISAVKSSPIVVRRIWVPTLDDYAPSPDGRYISCINWTKGNLAVHDLKTGEDRDLTDEGTWEGDSQYSGVSIWSPDSRQVAYHWFTGKGDELRIVDLDGSKPRVLCDSVPKGGHTPEPYGWSQDGKYILGLLGKKDESLERGHEDHIVLVSVADRSLRVLKSLGARVTQNMSLSPDGRYVVFELTTDVPKRRDIYLLATDGSGEATLVEHPADDWAPFWAPDGKRIVFVSDRTGSEGLWLLDLDDGKAKGAPTLVKEMGSNTWPKGFTPDGSFYYGIGTPSFDIYSATLDFKAGKLLAPPTKVSLRFEGSNYAPFWSPDGKYLAYASQRNSGRVLVIRDVESGQERDLSPETTARVLQRKGEATPRWSPDGDSFLVTAIDFNRRRGHRLILVDAETGNVTPIMPKKEDGEPAFAKWPVFSDDGKQVYYIGGPSIMVHNLETHKERELYRTNTYIYRLALAPDGRRLAFFEAARAVRPTVVKTMPASGGGPSELYALKEGKRFSWGVGLSWTPDGDYVVVGAPDATNKPDVLWMIPAEGGEPRKLELGVKVSHLSLHPDGQRIAFTRPEPNGGGEVWVMENFLPVPVASAAK
jgi:beta-lactamase regulating signal transducer with metallopeptidase domain/Tol biopolymer transport system component